jgi:RNA polymerase sigma factor (sigma-70 family)
MMQGLDGDAASQSRLLTELSSLLRGYYARRLRGDPSDVEDLVQETLIAVHARRESYDPARPFTAWAFAIARYKMIDQLRRLRVRPASSIDDAGPLFSDENHEAISAAMDLERLMSELPPQQRRAIRQVKIEGLSVEEAARTSGISVANVKISIHRGMKKLLALAQRGARDAN